MKKIIPVLAVLALLAACAKDDVELKPYEAPEEVVVVDSTRYPLKGTWKCYQYIQTVGTQTAITAVNWTLNFGDTMFKKDITGTGIYDFSYKLEYVNPAASLINIYYKPAIATPYEVTMFKVKDHYEYRVENLNVTGKDIYFIRK